MKKQEDNQQKAQNDGDDYSVVSIDSVLQPYIEH